jgi:4-alpha-glucanotransferase
MGDQSEDYTNDVTKKMSDLKTAYTTLETNSKKFTDEWNAYHNALRAKKDTSTLYRSLEGLSTKIPANEADTIDYIKKAEAPLKTFEDFLIIKERVHAKDWTNFFKKSLPTCKAFVKKAREDLEDYKTKVKTHNRAALTKSSWASLKKS